MDVLVVYRFCPTLSWSLVALVWFVFALEIRYRFLFEVFRLIIFLIIHLFKVTLTSMEIKIFKNIYEVTFYDIIFLNKNKIDFWLFLFPWPIYFKEHRSHLVMLLRCRFSADVPHDLETGRGQPRKVQELPPPVRRVWWKEFPLCSYERRHPLIGRSDDPVCLRVQRAEVQRLWTTLCPRSNLAPGEGRWVGRSETPYSQLMLADEDNCFIANMFL